MEVEIEKLDNFGRGICYINNKICFVKNAYPNDKVEIEITKETNKYIEATTKRIITKSKDRVESSCPYSNECGGCSLIDYKYEKENEYKENKVKNQVEKILKLDKNVVKNIEYSDEYNYRNKVVLHGKNNKIGLYKNNTQDIIEIDKCLLLSNKINNIIKKLKNHSIEEVLIRTSNNENEIILSIQSNNINVNKLDIKTDVLTINNKLITEKESIITNIKDKEFFLSANSFFQVNKTLTSKLYNEVYSAIKEDNNKTVLDLYCGTGSIGIFVADVCNKIIGIDYNKSNIEDAIKNKKLNNINNIEFICDKVENKINTFKDIETIIVDPPRKGLDNKTKKYLKEIQANKIVYVSCDLNTMIRDIKELSDKYKVEYIKPFNMFPRTYHVECVCLLCKKD